MKNWFYIFFTLLIHMCVCAQNKDITINGDGKIIPDTSLKDGKLPSKEEDVLAYFYANISDVTKIDKIVSFRFYQKTPYVKFRELLQQINKRTGKVIQKEVLKKEFSNDKKSVMFILKVTYEKLVANEKLIFIQESAGERFEVYEYQIKR